MTCIWASEVDGYAQSIACHAGLVLVGVREAPTVLLRADDGAHVRLLDAAAEDVFGVCFLTCVSNVAVLLCSRCYAGWPALSGLKSSD